MKRKRKKTGARLPKGKIEVLAEAVTTLHQIMMPKRPPLIGVTRTLTQRSPETRLDRVRMQLDLQGLLALGRNDTIWKRGCELGRESVEKLKILFI